MYAYSTTVPPQLIPLLGEYAFPPRVTLRFIHLQTQIVSVLEIHFVLAVHAHVQARNRLPLVYGFTRAATSFIHLGEEGFHCFRLGGDRICKFLHHCLDLTHFFVSPCIQYTCRIISSVGEYSLAIQAGLNIYDVLGLCVGLLLYLRRVFHICYEAAVYCCVGCPSLGDI